MNDQLVKLNIKPIVAFVHFEKVHTRVREIAALAKFEQEKEFGFVPFRQSAITRMFRTDSGAQAYFSSLRDIRELLERVSNDSAVSRLSILARQMYSSEEIDGAGNFKNNNDKAVNPVFASLAYIIALSQRFIGCVDDQHLQELRKNECPKVAKVIIERSDETESNMDYMFEAVFCGDTLNQGVAPIVFNDSKVEKDSENESDEAGTETEEDESAKEDKQEVEDEHESSDDLAEANDEDPEQTIETNASKVQEVRENEKESTNPDQKKQGQPRRRRRRRKT